MLIRLIELGMIVALTFLVVSQILVPAVRGTRLFPIFRKEHTLKEEVLDLNQEKYEAELADAIEQRKHEWFGTRDEKEQQ